MKKTLNYFRLKFFFRWRAIFKRDSIGPTSSLSNWRRRWEALHSNVAEGKFPDRRWNAGQRRRSNNFSNDTSLLPKRQPTEGFDAVKGSLNYFKIKVHLCLAIVVAYKTRACKMENNTFQSSRDLQVDSPSFPHICMYEGWHRMRWARVFFIETAATMGRRQTALLNDLPCFLGIRTFD